MEENNSNELNLLDLIRMFFNCLKRLGRGFLRLMGNSLRLLCRNLAVSVPIVAAAVVLGWYMGRPEVRQYKAEAMAVLNGSIAQTVKETSFQLETSSHLSDFTTLSAKLRLPDSITRHITGIESFYVIDFLNDSTPDAIDFKGKHLWTDTLNVRMPNRLYFRVKTHRVGHVPAIETAFVDYFNRNGRLRREFEVRRNHLQDEIRLVDREMARLDSMATISYLQAPIRQAEISRNSLLIGEQERQLFYTDLLGLQELKCRREAELEMCTAPVVLPTGFSVIPLPVHGRLFYLLVCGVIGIGVALLLSLLFENRKCIWNYLTGK